MFPGGGMQSNVASPWGGPSLGRMPKDARSPNGARHAPIKPHLPTPRKATAVAPTAHRDKSEASEPELPLLLVDDDAAVRGALAAMLESFGYAVETAESGEAGLGALGRSRLSVLLLGVRMPG